MAYRREGVQRSPPHLGLAGGLSQQVIDVAAVDVSSITASVSLSTTDPW